VEAEAQAKPQVQGVLPSRQVQGLVVVHAEELQEHPQEVHHHHHHPGKAQGLGVLLKWGIPLPSTKIISPHSIPFHSILCCSIPFHGFPEHSMVFYSIPSHSIPFHPILFHSMVLQNIPFHLMTDAHQFWIIPISHHFIHSHFSSVITPFIISHPSDSLLSHID
jgi:hypothetical protein